MDSTLNDFLNEIDEIAPLKSSKKENVSSDWKECFDEKSGFYYYWNTITDEVTWEKPIDFIPSKGAKSDSVKAAPSFPVMPKLIDTVKDTIKIYKLSDTQNSRSNSNTKSTNTKHKLENKKKGKPSRRFSGSDDEKITLISSYGSESESEEEHSEDEKKQSTVDTLPSNEDDELDILSTVKKRAEELKKITHSKDFINKNNETHVASLKPAEPKPSSGFSLVAGYDSNSDEEVEEDRLETKTINNSTPIEERTVSHSTLFPIMKPPDVKDFLDEPQKTSDAINNIVPTTPENLFDSKNFQRKRRLGVNFVPMNPKVSSNTERKGLGFSENTNDAISSSKTFYSNFTSGGVEFTKPDVQNAQEKREDDEENSVNMEEMVQTYEVLHEKLSFLCEGHKDVMPVQIILVQIETLFGALKAESLKPSYLNDWLEGTSEELLKLEKEAAPDGWLLQWDRSQKRYYYHNRSTGQGQWEYPQTAPAPNGDVREDEEAMDICTTPPPPDVEDSHTIIEEVQPPLPPSPPRKSPSPPPPPIISRPDPPLPEPPRAPTISKTNYEPVDQPLPPGVDYSESSDYNREKGVIDKNKENDINSAFDSFYTELAAIESTSNRTSPISNIEEVPSQSDCVQEPVKKKKKKVKLGQGLSLKKKDVSKLVEKWKNVQKNF